MEKTKDKFEPTTIKKTNNKLIFAAGLISLGVQKGDKVALLSEGRNAWIIGELGIYLRVPSISAICQIRRKQ